MYPILFMIPNFLKNFKNPLSLYRAVSSLVLSPPPASGDATPLASHPVAHVEPLDDVVNAPSVLPISSPSTRQGTFIRLTEGKEEVVGPGVVEASRKTSKGHLLKLEEEVEAALRVVQKRVRNYQKVLAGLDCDGEVCLVTIFDDLDAAIEEVELKLWLCRASWDIATGSTVRCVGLHCPNNAKNGSWCFMHSRDPHYQSSRWRVEECCVCDRCVQCRQDREERDGKVLVGESGSHTKGDHPKDEHHGAKHPKDVERHKRESLPPQKKKKPTLKKKNKNPLKIALNGNNGSWTNSDDVEPEACRADRGCYRKMHFHKKPLDAAAQRARAAARALGTPPKPRGAPVFIKCDIQVIATCPAGRHYHPPEDVDDTPWPAQFMRDEIERVIKEGHEQAKEKKEPQVIEKKEPQPRRVAWGDYPDEKGPGEKEEEIQQRHQLRDAQLIHDGALAPQPGPAGGLKLAQNPAEAKAMPPALQALAFPNVVDAFLRNVQQRRYPLIPEPPPLPPFHEPLDHKHEEKFAPAVVEEEPEEEDEGDEGDQGDDDDGFPGEMREEKKEGRENKDPFEIVDEKDFHYVKQERFYQEHAQREVEYLPQYEPRYDCQVMLNVKKPGLAGFVQSLTRSPCEPRFHTQSTVHGLPFVAGRPVLGPAPPPVLPVLFAPVFAPTPSRPYVPPKIVLPPARIFVPPPAPPLILPPLPILPAPKPLCVPHAPPKIDKNGKILPKYGHGPFPVQYAEQLFETRLVELFINLPPASNGGVRNFAHRFVGWVSPIIPFLHKAEVPTNNRLHGDTLPERGEMKDNATTGFRFGLKSTPFEQWGKVRVLKESDDSYDLFRTSFDSVVQVRIYPSLLDIFMDYYYDMRNRSPINNKGEYQETYGEATRYYTTHIDWYRNYEQHSRQTTLNTLNHFIQQMYRDAKDSFLTRPKDKGTVAFQRTGRL